MKLRTILASLAVLLLGCAQAQPSDDVLLQMQQAFRQDDKARLAQVTLQRAQYLQTRQYGPQTDVDTAQSQLDQAKAMIQKTEAVIAQKQIRAPFAGKLGVRQVDLGQYLNPGAPIVTPSW